MTDRTEAAVAGEQGRGVLAGACVICAVDFSEASERAAREAAELAGALGLPLELVHVHSVPSFVFPEGALIPSADQVARIAEAAQRALDSALAKVRAHVGDRTAVRATLHAGSPAEEIVRLAGELDAAVVVVGTHARGAIGRALLGSVAARVLREAPRPVLTVPGHGGPPACPPA